jgi:hypothetical protein
LRVFAAAYEQSRRACVAAIRCGDAVMATRHARRCHELKPDTDSRRFLALAALLRRDWPTAAALAQTQD